MIRYDSAYNKEINRVVSNFNRKVRRLEKEERELLPSPVSVRNIKEQFTNRRELNMYLNDLRRFSIRGAEDVMEIQGKSYTKYQIDLFRRNLRRERDEIRRDIKSAEAIKHQYPMQHNIYLQNLRSRKKALSMSWVNLIEKKSDVMIQRYFKRAEIYDNYLEILFQDAYLIGFDDDKINYIKERLLKLSPNKFIKALQDSPTIQFIFDFYHSLTRKSGVVGNNAYNSYQKLYEEIDHIVETYN